MTFTSYILQIISNSQNFTNFIINPIRDEKATEN